MGLIERVMGYIFGGGGGGNVITKTVEAFRENADSRGERDTAIQSAAMIQYAAEFHKGRRGAFDRFMDALNRVPRPAMALGTLGLFLAAMVSPAWFSERMAGIALVPEPLWWLLGVIVSFYFGARHQAKGQEFRKEIITTQTLAQTTQVAAAENPALEDWRKENGR